MFWQTAIGAVVSLIVTLAEQEALLPEASVPVRVTVVVPISAQPKVESLTTRLVMLQLSVEALSTAEADRVALPVASNTKLADLQIIIGETESITVTVELQVSVLPLASPRVRVTVLLPR